MFPQDAFEHEGARRGAKNGKGIERELLQNPPVDGT
jgi:hypothetical protein